MALNGEEYINLTKKVIECINANVFPSIDDQLVVYVEDKLKKLQKSCFDDYQDEVK